MTMKVDITIRIEESEVEGRYGEICLRSAELDGACKLPGMVGDAAKAFASAHGITITHDKEGE